jgi:hypothetical protein
MMRRFKVTESSDKTYTNQVFTCETRIKKDVELPFTTEHYRCVMFNGLTIRLQKDEKFIVANIW